MREQVRRLDALTGLRFVAAAAVVIYHVKSVSPEVAALFGVQGNLYGDVALGPTGVGFFFVLSGFILAYVYPRLATWGDAGRFLLARFARLWPGYASALVLSMVLAGVVFWPSPEGVYNPLVVLGTHVAMLQSWVPSHHMTAPYNGPGWSVSTEFAFYLFFIPLIHNWARTWWWKLPLTVAVPVGLAAAANVYEWPWAPPLGRPGYEHALYFNPLARVWQFALGMTTAVAWQRLGPPVRVGRIVGTVVELSAAALAVASVYYANQIGRAAQHTPGLGMPFYHLLYGCSAIPTLPFAVLIFVMAGEWGYVSRLFATPPLTFLGDISYGIYVLHWPLLAYVMRNQPAFAGRPGWQVLAAYWAVLLVMSHCLYAIVEQPARRWIVKLWPATPGEHSADGRLFGLLALLRSRTACRLGEAAALVAALLAIGLYVTRANVRFVNPFEVARFVKFAPASTRDVRFGDGYLLRGVTQHEAVGGIQFRMVWTTLKPQPPRFNVWVQGVTAAPVEECVWVVSSTPDMGYGPKDTPAGLVWEQRVFVPQDKLNAAAQVVMFVMNRDETGVSPAHGGRLDNHGRLLLIPDPMSNSLPVTVAGK